MHSSVEKLKLINSKVNDLIITKQLKTEPKVIVVTKMFSMDSIVPLLESGHIHYGENKVKEAQDKWAGIRKTYKNLQLHMIGKLQTNKVKKAVEIFDYIHSLDNERLALKISQCQKEINKNINLFIQVNVGEEEQKSGINIDNLKDFYHYCIKELSLNIIGLMCLPPFNQDSNKYFLLLRDHALNLNLNQLSMGMSSDFESAIINESTFIRVGTAILGERKST
jgi:pyridoxal phosphate enzyme (YggS family)